MKAMKEALSGTKRFPDSHTDGPSFRRIDLVNEYDLRGGIGHENGVHEIHDDRRDLRPPGGLRLALAVARADRPGIRRDNDASERAGPKCKCTRSGGLLRSGPGLFR